MDNNQLHHLSNKTFGEVYLHAKATVQLVENYDIQAEHLVLSEKEPLHDGNHESGAKKNNLT